MTVTLLIFMFLTSKCLKLRTILATFIIFNKKGLQITLVIYQILPDWKCMEHTLAQWIANDSSDLSDPVWLEVHGHTLTLAHPPKQLKPPHQIFIKLCFNVLHDLKNTLELKSSFIYLKKMLKSTFFFQPSIGKSPLNIV